MGITNLVAILQNSSATLADWNETADLVLRAQDGDRAAYGLLVEQFERTVYSVCLNRLDQLREPERFAGWLRQVAVRMAINRATRRVAPPSVETEILEGAGACHDDPLSALITRERAERLWAALERLKTLDRETLIAFYIDGDSLIAIADRLNTPIGTIKRRLHTARKRLKAELLDSTVEADEWSDGGTDEYEDAESDDVALLL